jgi:hypothetical protein
LGGSGLLALQLPLFRAFADGFVRALRVRLAAFRTLAAETPAFRALGAVDILGTFGTLWTVRAVGPAFSLVRPVAALAIGTIAVLSNGRCCGRGKKQEKRQFTHGMTPSLAPCY